jgi:hypothetical protein
MPLNLREFWEITFNCRVMRVDQATLRFFWILTYPQAGADLRLPLGHEKT